MLNFRIRTDLEAKIRTNLITKRFLKFFFFLIIYHLRAPSPLLGFIYSCELEFQEIYDKMG